MPKDTLDNDAWIEEVLENYAYETDGEMDCGHDGDFDVTKTKAIIQQHVEQAEAKARIEKLNILYSLADMYGQYCDGPYGHDFMSAGEGAIEILENYGLAIEAKGIDYKALDKLNEDISTLQQQLNKGDKE